MPQKPQRVALFVTCLVDQTMPEVGVAAARLLRRAGFAVGFPAAQTCCGQPFYNSGYRREAARLARHTIEVLEGYEAVVLPGGSCAAMLRVEYPLLFADSPAWQQRAHDLAARTFELSEFLVRRAGWQPAPIASPPRVTYHDSCHARRMLGLGAEARQLLTALGCTLVEMAEADRCCGFGGIFSVKMPEVSNAMTAEKLRQAAATQADILVTIDPGCLMQMRGLAGELPCRIEHLATLLEEATR